MSAMDVARIALATNRDIDHRIIIQLAGPIAWLVIAPNHRGLGTVIRIDTNWYHV